jgi:membrane associated rhomboid family serine protease
MFPIRDSVPVTRTPYVVLILIAINTAAFLYQTWLPDKEANRLAYMYGLVPLRYYNPLWAFFNHLSINNYWPFITATFLHGGWFHIIINMWTLYIFGSSLEGRIGSFQFLIFYLCCAVASTTAHAFFNQSADVPVIGASGAIAGVIGAYAITFPRASVLMIVPIIFVPLVFNVPALAFGAAWFFIQLLQGVSDLLKPDVGDPIAWWAHIGGFLMGLVLLPFFLLIAPEPRPKQKLQLGPWNIPRSDD